MLNSFETQKGSGTSFHVTIFVEFFDKIFFFGNNINWPNFINKLNLLPNLFSKMYFFFHVQVFNDVIKFDG